METPPPPSLPPVFPLHDTSLPPSLAPAAPHACTAAGDAPFVVSSRCQSAAGTRSPADDGSAPAAAFGFWEARVFTAHATDLLRSSSATAGPNAMPNALPSAAATLPVLYRRQETASAVVGDYEQRQNTLQLHGHDHFSACATEIYGADASAAVESVSYDVNIHNMIRNHCGTTSTPTPQLMITNHTSLNPPPPRPPAILSSTHPHVAATTSTLMAERASLTDPWLGSDVVSSSSAAGQFGRSAAVSDRDSAGDDDSLERGLNDHVIVKVPAAEAKTGFNHVHPMIYLIPPLMPPAVATVAAANYTAAEHMHDDIIASSSASLRCTILDNYAASTAPLSAASASCSAAHGRQAASNSAVTISSGKDRTHPAILHSSGNTTLVAPSSAAAAAPTLVREASCAYTYPLSGSSSYSSCHTQLYSEADHDLQPLPLGEPPLDRLQQQLMATAADGYASQLLCPRISVAAAAAMHSVDPRPASHNYVQSATVASLQSHDDGISVAASHLLQYNNSSHGDARAAAATAMDVVGGNYYNWSQNRYSGGGSSASSEASEMGRHNDDSYEAVEANGEAVAADLEGWKQQKRKEELYRGEASVGGGSKGRRNKVSVHPQGVAARRRRHRISNRFKVLQAMVPGGAKMDTASMLDEAILYVNYLRRQILLHHLMYLQIPAPAPLPIHCSSAEQQSSTVGTTSQPH